MAPSDAGQGPGRTTSRRHPAGALLRPLLRGRRRRGCRVPASRPRPRAPVRLDRLRGGVLRHLWAWVNYTWFASAYDSGDIVFRLLTFVVMSGVLVLAAGTPRAA